MKKMFIILGIAMSALLLCLFAAPYFFKDRILLLAKSEINKKINARVNFSDLDISLLRNFPRLSIAVDSLLVRGTGEFSEDTLISCPRFDLAVNLISAIRGRAIQIHSIKIQSPRILAILHKNGHANWDISLPDTSNTSASQDRKNSFSLDLSSYSMEDAFIHYQDDSSGIRSEIAHLNHSGTGNFSDETFTLKTVTDISELSFEYGSVPYLRKVRAAAKIDLQVNNLTRQYSFNTDEISVNGLKLTIQGFLQSLGDSGYNMNISFAAPSNQFRDFLSLIPTVYNKDFNKLKTSGEAAFSGTVRGVFDDKHIPSYHIRFAIKNGFFQYPDLPRPVKNINLSAFIENPDGVPDHSTIDISEAHIEMNESAFDFRILLQNPLSRRYIKAAVKGELDLAKLSQLIKLDDGTHLKGTIKANAFAEGNLADLEKKSYGQFNAGGSFSVTNFVYSSAAFPDQIEINTASLSLNPKNAVLSGMKGTYRKMNINANGTLNNLLGYALNNRPLDGDIDVEADRIDLDSWLESSKDSTKDIKRVPDASVLVVPSNLALTIHATSNFVQYGRINLEKVSGSLLIENEIIRLQNLKANSLQGSIMINGAYSTRESKKTPAFAFAYDLKQLDVQQTFQACNTMQKLMPVAKFIDGKMSSRLSLSGLLLSNMNPDLNSLSGEGSLELNDGFLRKFAAVDKLAEMLKLDQLKDFSVKEVKASFSFKNGRVYVNPFHVQTSGIDMEVGGTHGFDQTMDYSLLMNIPTGKPGIAANTAITNLIEQVSNKSVPIKLPDQIKVKVKITGSISSPVLSVDLKENLSQTAGTIKSQINDLVKAKVDSAKMLVQDTLASVGRQLAKNAAEELKKQLTGEKDSTGNAPNTVDNTRKKLEETGKGLLDNLLRKKK